MTEFLEGYYIAAKPFLDFLSDYSWGIVGWLALMCLVAFVHAHFNKNKKQVGIVNVVLITPPTVILIVTYSYILITIFWGLMLGKI